MNPLLELHNTRSPTPPLPRTVPDERGAREQLLAQIAKLERELGTLFASSFPRQGFEWAVSSAPAQGPRLLSVGDLETVRDRLAARLQHNRRALEHRTRLEEAYRREIEEMLHDPSSHRWKHVSAEDIGERGCKHWHVRPRLGLLGMLKDWWRVRISSGCPLSRHERVSFRESHSHAPCSGGAGMRDLRGQPGAMDRDSPCFAVGRFAAEH